MIQPLHPRAVGWLLLTRTKVKISKAHYTTELMMQYCFSLKRKNEQYISVNKNKNISLRHEQWLAHFLCQPCHFLSTGVMFHIVTGLGLFKETRLPEKTAVEKKIIIKITHPSTDFFTISCNDSGSSKATVRSMK